jgi:DNA/RNA endonuclease YhcR with UshA esterase domain
MSALDFTDSAWWGGKPVARRAADARVRGRVVVTGTIVSTRAVHVGGSMSLSCVLGDGTGEIGLLFIGRPAIAGLVEGARCTVEGIARMESNQLVLWNPLYRLESPR